MHVTVYKDQHWGDEKDDVVLLSTWKTAQCDLFSIIEQIDLAGKGLHEEYRKKQKCLVSMWHSCRKPLEKEKQTAKPSKKKQNKTRGSINDIINLLGTEDYEF